MVIVVGRVVGLSVRDVGLLAEGRVAAEQRLARFEPGSHDGQYDDSGRESRTIRWFFVSRLDRMGLCG